jgi:hypothetical protein
MTQLSAEKKGLLVYSCSAGGLPICFPIAMGTGWGGATEEEGLSGCQCWASDGDSVVLSGGSM